MRLKLLLVTSRLATFELEDFGAWWADSPYEVWLNGRLVEGANRTVHSLYGLVPATRYHLEVRATSGARASLSFETRPEAASLNVRRFGAAGDGVHHDGAAIQAAIAACPVGGRVLVPAGVYPVHCLFLKSGITLELAKNARIQGVFDPENHPILPGMVQGFAGECNLSSWEGNPLDAYAAILTGIDIQDTVVCGQGSIDGGGTPEGWWRHPEGRGRFGPAFRPRMVFLNRCKNVTFQGLSLQNSPSWNLHPYFCVNTRWLDLSITAPPGSPNTDGLDPESVTGLEAVGIYFSLGDDCVAIKSGKYAMAQLYKTPSSGIRIRRCYMHRGHGSVTLGSELAAGIHDVVVEHCIFDATDRGLRIKTRRGRGADAVIDGIVFRNIHMRGVLTPFVVNSYYHCCDPDGHSDYVASKAPLPVDGRTPTIGSLRFENIRCEGAQVAAAFVYGLPEAKIQSLQMQNVSVAFAQNAQPGLPAMMDGVQPVARQGMLLKNIASLRLSGVQVQGQQGPALLLEGIDRQEN